MTEEKRLDELRSKETLTDEEMNELRRYAPKRSGPNLLTMGIVDLEQSLANFQEGPERSRRALENGCYLEVISLRLQHIDFWLRIFWVVRNQHGKIFDPNDEKDKRFFGTLVNQCEQLKFKSDLIKRMKAFNDHRTKAIHKYLLGATSYSELKTVCEETTGLDREVGEYVRNEVGI